MAIVVNIISSVPIRNPHARQGAISGSMLAPPMVYSVAVGRFAGRVDLGRVDLVIGTRAHVSALSPIPHLDSLIWPGYSATDWRETGLDKL